MDESASVGDVYVTAIIMELRGEIAARGISKKKLAEDLGVSYAALNRYLAGQRDLPADLLFRILIDHFDMDLERFWRRVTDRWSGEMG